MSVPPAVKLAAVNLPVNPAASASSVALPVALKAAPDGTLSVRSLTGASRSEEHTSELQSLMRISYAVFCLKKKKQKAITVTNKIEIVRNEQQQHHTQKHEIKI